MDFVFLDSGSKKAKIIQKSVGLTHSTLAPRTEMRSAPRQQDSANRGLASRAGLPRSLVYAVFELKEAAFSIGVDVVGDRRATEPDGLL
jgi:hypothetical protein